MVLLISLAAAGCVERTMTISTTPDGALVWLNDKEVGRTPVKVPFEWYGDYDVVIRKEGFQTLKTDWKLVAPWYQYPPIDFFAELLTPATIYDEHARHFDLDPVQPTSKEELVARALEFRSEATGEVPGGAPTSPPTEPKEGRTTHGSTD
jgi:hypothetical protein